MKRSEALEKAVTQLRTAGIDRPEQDARLILSHCLNVALHYILLEPEVEVSENDLGVFQAAIKARAKHQPVSQIIEKRAFWKHEFKVTQAVLDPRPETEQLVEVALKTAKITRVLDLGTGSGCILLSILADRPQATGLGTDLSQDALKVAKGNAISLNLQSRASFTQSSWFENITQQFDLIVSNPPYITEAEMQQLSPDVVNWEPHLALTPGGDGLDAYREIAQKLSRHLSSGGRAVFECGVTQTAAITEIFAKHGFKHISTYTDLTGRPRGICLKN